MSVTVEQQSSSAVSSGDLVVAKPAFAAIGDVFAFVVAYRGSASIPSPPAGLTTPAGITNPIQTGTASTDTRMRLYYVEIDGATPASWTFTPNLDNRLVYTGVLLRGVDLDGELEDASSATGLTAPSLDSVSTDAFAVYFSARWHTGADPTDLVVPTGFTEHDQSQSGNNLYATCGTKQLGAAGSTGALAGSQSSANGTTVSAGLIFKPLALAVNVKVWDGSAWADPVSDRTWDGSAWV